MMLVLVHFALLMTLCGIVARQAGSALLVEEALGRRAQRESGSVRALSRGLSLFETGTPPTDPYDCQVTLSTPDGEVAYTVRFESTDSTGEGWSVTASPTAEGEMPPAMPGSF